MILIIFFVKSMQLTRNELWLMMVNCDVTTVISMFYHLEMGHHHITYLTLLRTLVNVYLAEWFLILMYLQIFIMIHQ